jgi:DNA-binding NarL/FixJ family response regulator
VNRRHGVEGPINRLAQELERAVRFEDAAQLVCDAAVRLGIATCRVVRGSVDGALTMPVIGQEGWFATVLCDAADATQQRELAMLAMYLSVWCAGRSIGSAVDAALTRRQTEVAELAALGHTNAEIAASLGISVNTVKARLKEVFERLGVCNRTELANVLRQTAPMAARTGS